MQRHLRCHMMIQLDTSPIWFLPWRERNAHRRLFLKGVVQENDCFVSQLARQKWIPKPPNRFAEPTDREKIINQWHRPIVRSERFHRNLYQRTLGSCQLSIA